MIAVENNIQDLILKFERLHRQAHATAKPWQAFLTGSASFKLAEMGEVRFRLTPEYAEAVEASAGALKRAEHLLTKAWRAEDKARRIIRAERAKRGLSPELAIWLAMVSKSGRAALPL